MAGTTVSGVIYGNQGGDEIGVKGTNVNATVYGGQDADTINAGGSSGEVVLYGNMADDMIIVGGSGDATVFGGQHNDVISVAAGASGVSHEVSGNLGTDTFVWNFATLGGSVLPSAASTLVIKDLEVGEELSFDSGGGLTSLTALSGIATVAETGADVAIALATTGGGSVTITLEGIADGAIDDLQDLVDRGYNLTFA